VFLIKTNGGDFTSKEFMEFCSEHGIKRQFSVAMTPQQNGVVERTKQYRKWPKPC
jgi:transposase InsO family protein